MEYSNIIASIIGGIIVAAASTVIFALTPWNNLKSKRLEKKLEYRTQLFLKIVDLRLHMIKYMESPNQFIKSRNQFIKSRNQSIKEFQSLVFDVNTLIRLYAYEPEIESFEESVIIYNYCIQDQDKKKDIQYLNDDNRQNLIKTSFTNFFTLSINTYQEELLIFEGETRPQRIIKSWRHGRKIIWECIKLFFHFKRVD